MNQSIFIIRHDYFDDPLSGKDYIKDLIESKCISERVALVFDPLAEDFLSHVASSNRDKLEEIVSNFYNHWETSSGVLPLKWYQLDDIATFHVTFLSPLLYEISEKFGVYLLGCIPLLHYSDDLYIYFRMSSYDTEDIFYLIDGNNYINHLEGVINNFNEYVYDLGGISSINGK
ncbi:MAG: hypothetical protein ACOCV8_05180 [Spirochaetota bacterium]